jgi:phosphoribosylanthranilate isomerase
MIDGIRLKICGLTSLVDAELADRCGADYLGFVLYPKSPRHVSLMQFRAMGPRLPERRKVAVCVEPTAEELTAYREAGFDFFQIHYRPEAVGSEQLTEWSQLVTEKRLWLAPKLPPEAEVPAAALALAKFIVLDTFHAGGFGGSGRTGDWAKFARVRKAHRRNFWVLAGGLSPETIGPALRESGAKFVDVNSGIESAPGVKDFSRMKAFMVALHRAASG